MSMRRARTTLVVLAAAAAIAAGTAGAQTAPKAKPAAKPAAAAPKHVMVAASDVKWGPGPPSLPPGAQMAVLDGDPAVAGKPFVIRAKLPDGYRVAPHWHPTDENVSVLSGTFSAGIGDTFNEGSMMALGPGGYAKMPKMTHHYAMAKGETIIQVHGNGPFAVTYVNAKDDPRTKK
jgi:anti-sigma factor ChrR (cupin superfamily)